VPASECRGADLLGTPLVRILGMTRWGEATLSLERKACMFSSQTGPRCATAADSSGISIDH
jgi:hypothetical protein